MAGFLLLGAAGITSWLSLSCPHTSRAQGPASERDSGRSPRAASTSGPSSLSWGHRVSFCVGRAFVLPSQFPGACFQGELAQNSPGTVNFTQVAFPCPGKRFISQLQKAHPSLP